MAQIKLTHSAHGEHMMCTRVYTLVQTSLYTTTKQFAFKKFMWRGVKSFFKVQNKSVNLTLFFSNIFAQSFITVIN